MAILADDLSEGRAGRLVQQVVEIFTYSHMALMALPEARSTMSLSSEIEKQLEQTVSEMSHTDAGSEAEQHQDTLLGLAARAEHQVAQSSFCFSAAKAYHSLVERRFEEMRESRIPGSQMPSNFLDRHLAPAMRTCEAAAQRLEDLALRIDLGSRVAAYAGRP